MNFNSQVIENAVQSLSSFPGIGKKTALRMVIHLINSNDQSVKQINSSIDKLKTELKSCKECGNISENEICNICTNPLRDSDIICIVCDFKDVLAVENTASFRGKYHVLGGLISPMDGVSPDDLNIDSLLERAENSEVTEIIIALSATLEGDTTTFYLSKILKNFDLKISTIAKGIAVGGEIEYADEITLGRSISNRILYEI
jgi:recombination protein RecR